MATTPITEIRAFLESGTLLAARTNIGLGNVDNTTDLLKPVSTATLAVTDAITARDWVEIADNTYSNTAPPSSYPIGQVYVMAITTTIGYPCFNGVLVTETRTAPNKNYITQTIKCIGTGELETFTRKGVETGDTWEAWQEVIVSEAGVIAGDLSYSGQQELTGQLLTTADSTVNRALGDARYAELSTTEILVKTAADLSGTLSSNCVYKLDGFIAMGSQTITVPAGGLTIEGGGRRVSGLSTAQASYSMFIDAAGDAGTLNLCCLDISCTGAGSQIFDLDNAEAGGFVTSIDVSYTNPVSIGELTSYAAALFENNTVFNATDGITFSGTWSAGIRVSLFVGISGVTGLTYFSEGTALTFGSRFISNANLNIPTSGAGYNFSESNFLNDGQFELLSGDLSGAGSPVTGITQSNVKSKWRDNNGLSNTYVGTRWQVTTETATTVGAANTYYKLAGTTTYEDEQWFSNTTDNAPVYDSTNEIECVINGTMSISSGNNNQIQVEIRQWDDSAAGYVVIHEHGPITMSGAGAGENIALLGFASLAISDRIEVWAQNLTGATNITMLEGTLVSVSERAN